MIDTNATTFNGSAKAPPAAPAAPRAQKEAEAEALPPLGGGALGTVVELTDCAKAVLLRDQGCEASEIAVRLGLDERTVDSYLNLGPKLGL
jgi:hypothetical protein